MVLAVASALDVDLDVLTGGTTKPTVGNVVAIWRAVGQREGSHGLMSAREFKHAVERAARGEVIPYFRGHNFWGTDRALAEAGVEAIETGRGVAVHVKLDQYDSLVMFVVGSER